MPWTRLSSEKIATHLRFEITPAGPDDAGQAERVLNHLRGQLTSGRFVAIQDHEGRLFIGTPDEAAEHPASAILQDGVDPA